MEKDFERMVREIREFNRDDFPIIVATEAENHFKKSFDNQGFTDQALLKWKPRDVDLHPEKYSKRERAKSQGRAILIGHNSGDHLRDSIHSIRSQSQVIITSNKAYANIHNKGGQAGRNLSATIPQRQFAAHSAVLDLKVKRKLDIHINKIFKI